ncbi:MAG: hypothetical protein ABI741_03895 [Ferruginibacter sp.]
MKKYIGIALCIMICNESHAQIQRTVVKQKPDSTATEQVADKKTDSRKEIFRELDLTKEQKVKMKEINQSMKASKETIENDAALSDPQKKEKLKTLRKEQAIKIQAILTEEQKIKFRELKTKNKDNG